MTPWEVLARLRAHRVEVLVEGEHLRLRAPVGAITEELRRAVELHKACLLRLLTGSPPATRAARITHLLGRLQAHCVRHTWMHAALCRREVDHHVAERVEQAWNLVAREARRFVDVAAVSDLMLRAALARHDELLRGAARLAIGEGGR